MTTTTTINNNMGMEGLVKYADITTFTIVNNFTFIFVPYAFGFDYANGDRDNRHRLQECISEVWKILIKMGFTEVKMSKDGAIKAKTFATNGDVEKYWKITIFRDTFEKPANPEKPLPPKLERSDTVFEGAPFPTVGGLQRYDTVVGTLPPRKPDYLISYTENGPAPTLHREFSSYGEPVMKQVDDCVIPSPPKLGRTESVCSDLPTKPPGLQRQITSSANVGLMRDLKEIDVEKLIVDDAVPPITRQKTVHFDDKVITEHIEPEGDEEPHGLVLNVWRLTGEGFEFYDMFKEFKDEILRWK